jgi:hypothetical protein
VKIKKTSADLIFLLEDNTYLHLEFQTNYKLDDLIRFSEYNLKIYMRAKQKVKTVIIYSSDVKSIETLDTGSVLFTPLAIMMYDYNGDKIFKELEIKLQKKQKLTGIDVMSLALLPLMKNSISKTELAKKTIKMANTIENKDQRDLCIASAIAFAERYLSKAEMNELEGVIEMFDIVEQIVTKNVNKNLKKRELELAKEMLLDSKPMEDIIKYSKLSKKQVEKLAKELNEQKNINNQKS